MSKSLSPVSGGARPCLVRRVSRICLLQQGRGGVPRRRVGTGPVERITALGSLPLTRQSRTTASAHCPRRPPRRVRSREPARLEASRRGRTAALHATGAAAVRALARDGLDASRGFWLPCVSDVACMNDKGKARLRVLANRRQISYGVVWTHPS